MFYAGHNAGFLPSSSCVPADLRLLKGVIMNAVAKLKVRVRELEAYIRGLVPTCHTCEWKANNEETAYMCVDCKDYSLWKHGHEIVID